MPSKIIKRDGRVVEFDRAKITEAIWKAIKSVGGKDRALAERLSNQVVERLGKQLKPGEIPHVEQVQDLVEKVLVENNLYNVAKAYILYRALHAQIREFVDSYLENKSWLVKENANTTYSLQALNFHISSQVISQYWLHRIFNKGRTEIREAHLNGDFHIHNLGILGPYCVGWDLRDLLTTGFRGVRGKVSAKPAKHFRVALGHVVNFVFTLQGEAAGAQAFSSFDTYLAPFIRYDNLDYKSVKQALQEFMFNMNIPTRVGFQTPFSNVTLDLRVPSFMKDEPVIIGGQVLDDTYGDFQEEMNVFNRALAEVMLEGDAVGRVFTFPIPTINITKDFNWDDETVRKVLETSAKYGIPYFANFVNSDMNPEDVRSMCLHPDEELLIRNSGNIGRKTIGEIVEKYAGKFENDGWAEPSREVEALSLNPETWKVEWAKIKRFLRVTDRKMVKIVTEDGKTIKVSRNHLIPVVTINGIINKLAKDVEPGDIVLTLKSASRALAANYEKIGSLILDEKLAGLLGFFIADGNYLIESRKNKTYGLPMGLQFTFGSKDPLLRKTIEKLIKDVLGCSVREKRDKRYNTYYLYVYSTDIARAFYNAGFKKYGRLPQVIFNSPPTVIKAFLKYFFLGDGYEKNKEIHLNDGGLARDLAILFSMVGMPVCYREKKKSQRIYIQHKKSKTNSVGNLTIPTLYERVPGWMAKSTYVVPGLNKGRMVGVETLSKYDAHTEESKRFVNGDVMLVRVVKCELIDLEKEQEFFDIELEKNHLFIHSLGNITHNCCHLRLDKRELKKRGGGLFGANPLTGSVGVVTINMPRIGFLSKSEGEFFARLDRIMVLAKDVLEIKRKWLEKFTEAGLYPYSRFYLRHIKESFGYYWKNHFSTIGLIGMYEACLNFLGCSIGEPEGLSFSIKVLDFMRKRLQDFQEETGNIFNLEATPAEGTSHRLARIDKKTYPSIIVANEEEVKRGAAPYYTNSTHLPVYYTDDLWEYLRLQDPLQTRYTGGTVVHVWLGESNPPVESVAALVRKICENFKLPYFTLTPTFSICPEDGYLAGEQHTCPKCGRTAEVYSRVVGYLRPVEQWNQGKQEEFKQRKVFDKAIAKKLVAQTSE
ncbi:MAG: anaerobic ribonucleoside-triphosphate reductase [Thermoproteota archaeon]